MTPEQKIKQLILLHWLNDEAEIERIKGLGGDAIDEEYCDTGAENEVREGEVKTDIPCSYDRNYESESVAAQAIDGSWVGWTYWYGGGKHGNPEEIEWMQDAYDLSCMEEQKMVTVRTFTKVES